jgi:phosphate transport system permease protein
MASRTIAPREAAREQVARALTGRRSDVSGMAFQFLLLLTLVLALAVLIVLLVEVARTAIPVLQERSDVIFESGYSSLPANAGIRTGIIGSLYLMTFVVVIALPLGVGAAIYMEEYAKDTRLTRFINTNIRNLAGVPAIVYGILGLAIFVELLGAFTGPDVEGRSLLAGALTISVMVLPIIIITTQEALRAVPRSIREAGFGVGATRWEVIRSHVLPYAAPGILTGTILSVSRAIGEAAPLLLIGAVTGLLGSSGGLVDQLRDRFTAMPIVIYQWAQEADRDFQPLVSGGIIVLMAVILVLNAFAIFLRNRYERKW